jgi:hypothetical protein
MALTINPAVSRGHRPWLVDSVAFFVGALFGGFVSLLLMLFIAQALGLAFADHRLALVGAAVVALAALHDVGVPTPLPYRPRQVPEWLREVLPPTAVAIVFGFMLGIGFLTLFTYSVHLAMLIGLPFLDSLGQMLAVVAVFAFGKSLVLVAATGASRLERIAPRFRWTRWRQRLLRAATATASTAIACALVVSAATS